MTNLSRTCHGIMSAVLLMVLCTQLTSCWLFPDDDDDDEVLSKSILMQSKWMAREMPDFTDYGDWAELTANTYFYYFTSETEGVLRWYYKWIDSSGVDDEGTTVSNVFFTYTVSGNTVTCEREDGYTARFTYSDGCLHKDGLTFEPVTPSSGDWEAINKLQKEREYKNDFNFDYEIGFDGSALPCMSTYNSRTKTYTHRFYMNFGVPANTRLRGISTFGIALTCSDGTIDNSVGWADGGVYVEVHKIGSLNTKCFLGSVSSDDRQSWLTMVTVTSKNRTARLEYRSIFNAGSKPTIDYNYFDIDSKGYVYSIYTHDESVTPSWLVDTEGNRL